jgi:hypothetical protein
MNKTEALQITGSLSNPSKMPGKAYGLPAKECKTGSKLSKDSRLYLFQLLRFKGLLRF